MNSAEIISHIRPLPELTPGRKRARNAIAAVFLAALSYSIYDVMPHHGARPTLAKDKSGQPKALSTTVVTTSTLGQSGYLQSAINYTGEFHDGYKIHCSDKATITIKTTNDTLAHLATKGLISSDLMTSYVYEANLDFNDKNHGLKLKDYPNMQPGDKFDILSDCVLTSPIFSFSPSDKFYDVDYQSNNSFYQYDANTNRLTYCQPEPSCAVSGPPSS